MIDTKFIGMALPAFHATAEPNQLRFFAKATGQNDPVYFDTAAAKDAGHPALPVPPTFLFCRDMDQTSPGALRELLGFDIGRVLHGEQSFVYHRMAYAGQRLSFETRIADIYTKKAGALEFVVRETRLTDDAGEPVADLRSVIVVRTG